MIAEKRNKNQRRNWIWGLGLMCVISVGVFTLNLIPPNSEDIPVFHEKMILKLPQIQVKEETIQNPFDQGEIAVNYFNGISSEIPTVVEFEGVYRPSQGVDIVHQGETFPVKAALSGEVIEVIADYLLGQSISIKSDNLVITYQSLSDLSYKKGDTIRQGNVIGKASTSVYQASLGNHLHIVVEKDGKIVDPNTIFNLR